MQQSPEPKVIELGLSQFLDIYLKLCPEKVRREENLIFQTVARLFTLRRMWIKCKLRCLVSKIRGLISQSRVTEPHSESGPETQEARHYPEGNWGNKSHWTRVGFTFRTYLMKSPKEPENASFFPK